jgi:hypothetical protein
MTRTFGIRGQVITAQPTRRTFELVPRHPAPLPPAAPLPEPADQEAPAELAG